MTALDIAMTDITLFGSHAGKLACEELLRSNGGVNGGALQAIETSLRNLPRVSFSVADSPGCAEGVDMVTV